MARIQFPTDQNRHLSLRVKRPCERRSLSRSATRALDVLEAFGEARRPLRAVEIARMLELTASSANQLLKTMAESAHLLFDARTKLYQPSPRLAAIASWISETYAFESSLSDLVRDVWTSTGYVTTVTAPSDLFMQVIDLCGVEGVSERGLKVSLFGSATGAAFLSTVDDAEVRRLAERARMPDAEAPAIMAMLAAVRETGHAVGPSRGSDVWSIAIPLPKSVLNGQGVLGIAGPGDVMSAQSERYCTLMQNAVSRWLAGQKAPHEAPA